MITVDVISGTGLEDLVDADLMDEALDDLAEGARSAWIAAARQELRSTREDYIRGLQEVENEITDIGDDGYSTGARVIRLTGAMPNYVENGMAPFDMHETLLNANARMSRDGHLYRAIPFRHGTPGSAGMAGSPMGSQYGPRGERSASRLGRMVDAPTARAWGERVYDSAKRMRRGERLVDGMVPRLSPEHTTDIYAGMIRERHTYGRTTQSKYSTFRTISEAVPEKWQHPGIVARHLIEAADRWVRDNAPRVIARAIRRALGAR